MKLGSWFTCADGVPLRWDAVFHIRSSAGSLTSACHHWAHPPAWVIDGFRWSCPVLGQGPHHPESIANKTISSSSLALAGAVSACRSPMGPAPTMPSLRRGSNGPVEKITRTAERCSTRPGTPASDSVLRMITLCSGMDLIATERVRSVMTHPCTAGERDGRAVVRSATKAREDPGCGIASTPAMRSRRRIGDGHSLADAVGQPSRALPLPPRDCTGITRREPVSS